MQDLDRFITRYMAMWHEPDAGKRRAVVAELFAEDAHNITARSEQSGIDGITARVKRAHDEWVAQKNYRFVPAGNTQAQYNLVKFFWHMVPQGGGKIEAMGLDIFVLNPAGKVQALYQFNEPTPQG
jgi:hypothetical protein